MSPCYVIILMTLLACVTIHDAAPPTRDRSRDWALADKRGGIPSRFRGNSFHNSLHPMVQQRAVMTPTGDDVIEDEDESAARDHDVRTRDFLGAILGMGMSQSNQPSHTDRIYNSYNYEWNYNDYRHDYDDYDDEDDWYYDDYYDEYDVTARELTDDSDNVTSANVTDDASYDAKRRLPKRQEGAGDVESSEGPPTRRRLVSRDYLFTIMGMGAGRRPSEPYRFDHHRYNNQYYYDHHDDDYDYDYYDYYDYDYDHDSDSEDDDSDSDDGDSDSDDSDSDSDDGDSDSDDGDSDSDEDDESDSESEEDDRKREFGAQKSRTAAAKRASPTLTANKLESRTESKRRTPTLSATGHQVQSRDYLGILGMGGGHGMSGHHHDHAHYNEHYYYDDINDGYDDYYDYGYYYDDDYGDYKREVDKQKTRTAPGRRKTPTLRDNDIEHQLESLHDSEEKTPTVERSRFLNAIKRYMLADDVRRK